MNSKSDELKSTAIHLETQGFKVVVVGGGAVIVVVAAAVVVVLPASVVVVVAAVVTVVVVAAVVVVDAIALRCQYFSCFAINEFQVSDAALRGWLFQHSVPDGSMDPFWQDERRCLTWFKNRLSLYDECPLKSSQLCKRSVLCPLGFEDGKSQTGRCDSCHAWSRAGESKLEKLYHDRLDNVFVPCDCE